MLKIFVNKVFEKYPYTIYTLAHTNILKLEISSHNITLVIFNIRTTNPMHEKTSNHVMVTEKFFYKNLPID